MPDTIGDDEMGGEGYHKLLIDRFCRTDIPALHGRQQVERVPGLGVAALQLPGARGARLIEAVIAHERDNGQRDGGGRGGDEGGAPLDDGRVGGRRGACNRIQGGQNQRIDLK